MRRGFQVGTPRNRLSDYDRAVIVEMLKIIPCSAEVTRRFNFYGGRVSLPTVCAIRAGAIRRGELAPRPSKKRVR
jgi:hypothetical protein